jgi:hypothetical protein
MDTQTPNADTAIDETESESPLSRIFIRSLLRSLAATLPSDDRTSAEISADMWDMARELFFDMNPQTAVEAVYAARAIAAHFAAMDMYARAAKPGTTNEKAQRMRNTAIAASRSFDNSLQRMEQRRARTTAKPAPAHAQPALLLPALPPSKNGAVDRSHNANQPPPAGWRSRFTARPTATPGG